MDKYRLIKSEKKDLIREGFRLKNNLSNSYLEFAHHSTASLVTCVSPRLGGGRCEEHGGGEDPLHGEMLAGAGAGGDCGLGSGSQLPAADLEPVHQHHQGSVQAAGRRRHQEPACSHTTA